MQWTIWGVAMAIQDDGWIDYVQFSDITSHAICTVYIEDSVIVAIWEKVS